MTTTILEAPVQLACCTCHNPPRPISRENDQSEWGHTDEPDGEPTFADVFHVHMDSDSRDCDGPMDRSHTYQITSIKNCESADDLWRALVRMELTAHAIKQVVEINGDEHEAVFHETTDEGYHAVHLRGCTNTDCAHDKSTQRDHYAEAMGY